MAFESPVFLVNCTVCGKRMVRFENPERWTCPGEASHGAIQREERKSRKGKGKGTLGGFSKKKKKK